MPQNESFEYNLPVQAYRGDDNKISLINYMPRRNSCIEVDLSEFIEDINNEQEVKDFFYGVAINLLNLSILFVEFANKDRDAVYYHDEDIDKHFYPSSYQTLVEQILIKHCVKKDKP